MVEGHLWQSVVAVCKLSELDTVRLNFSVLVFMTSSHTCIDMATLVVHPALLPLPAPTSRIGYSELSLAILV